MRIKRDIYLNRLQIALIIFLSFTAVFVSITVLLQYRAVSGGFVSGVVRIENRQLAPRYYINISMTYLPVEIIFYDGDFITLDYIGETELFVAEEDDDFVLKISQDDEFALNLLTPDMLSYGLKLKLPQNPEKYREINITTTAGDIKISSPQILNAEKINITSRSGNCFLVNTYADTIINTISGTVRAEFNKDIQKKGYELAFFTNSGRFTSDFFRKKCVNESGGAFLSLGKEPKRISVETNNGDLSIIINN